MIRWIRHFVAFHASQAQYSRAIPDSLKSFADFIVAHDHVLTDLSDLRAFEFQMLFSCSHY